MKYYTLNFAQAYGSGQYGSGKYSCTTQQQQDGTCTPATGGATGSGSGTGTGAGGTGGSQLTNTGIAVMAIVTIACLIIFVSLIVRIWRRKPTLQPQEVVADAADTQATSRQ
jgi:hypothetical protein